MRILLDECLPRDLARQLPGHKVKTVPQSGWASVSNGKLLRLIADSGKFDVFLTVDKNLPQQNQNPDAPLRSCGLAREIQPHCSCVPFCCGNFAPHARISAWSRLCFGTAGLNAPLKKRLRLV
jgi:hypothetical protein